MGVYSRGVLSKYFKTISSAKVYLGIMQFFSVLSILLGSIISMLSFYGLAIGNGITLSAGPGTISLDPLLAGFLLEIAGILLAFEGIMVLKTVLKVSQLSIISILFGYCSLNIPAIFLGFGYSLIAGAFAVVFGFLWLITVLAWLQRGE